MLAARLGAKMDSLSPFLWDSFIPYNMPVYPGARRVVGKGEVGARDSHCARQLVGAQNRKRSSSSWRTIPKYGFTSPQPIHPGSIRSRSGLQKSSAMSLPASCLPLYPTSAAKSGRFSSSDIRGQDFPHVNRLPAFLLTEMLCLNRLLGSASRN